MSRKPAGGAPWRGVARWAAWEGALEALREGEPSQEKVRGIHLWSKLCSCLCCVLSRVGWAG